MKWKAIPGPDLHIRSWNDEVVVYNGLSGDTHLISPAAADLLEALRHEPADQASLLVSMAALWETDPNPELHAGIGQLLTELDALALIRQAQP
jgi:PqqD family protein of HPr-rel-A system